MESNGLQGGSSVFLDMGVNGCSAMHHHGHDLVQDLDGIEAARERAAVQRPEDAEKIRREQKEKQFWMEVGALKQRAAYLEWKAEEMIRRHRETEGEESDSEASSTATPDGGGSGYAPTEVFSESEQQLWVTTPIPITMPMEES
jgi:hypothetical protein